MNRIRTHFSLLAGLIALGVIWTPIQAAQPAEPASGLALMVRVYTLSPEAIPHLARALPEAAELLEATGLRVRWLHCPAGQQRDAVCEEAPQAGEIRLRIVAGHGQGELGRSLGYALPLEQSEGVNATVLFGAVERTRRGTAVSTAHLLGHVVAHEIGHLLLGTNSHSRGGLMAGRWDSKDLLRVAQHQLHFSEPQTRRIRQDVQARMLAQTATHAGSLLAMNPAKDSTSRSRSTLD